MFWMEFECRQQPTSSGRRKKGDFSVYKLLVDRWEHVFFILRVGKLGMVLVQWDVERLKTDRNEGMCWKVIAFELLVLLFYFSNFISNNANMKWDLQDGRWPLNPDGIIDGTFICHHDRNSNYL